MLSRIATTTSYGTAVFFTPLLLWLCDLQQYFSDVLYSLKTTAEDGYIHVLV